MYYLIAIFENGKAVHTRTEKAKDPKEACMAAYGIIYNKPGDTAKYLELGTRSPKYMSTKKYTELVNNASNWKKIPQ